MSNKLSNSVLESGAKIWLNSHSESGKQVLYSMYNFTGKKTPGEMLECFLKDESKSYKRIYRRRRYGPDVVIFTKQGGFFMTVKKSKNRDPWVFSGMLLILLNK